MARIVIVEDEVALREDIALYLKSEGHEVFQAESWTDIEPLLPGGIDLVVLDVNLRGESGFDIAARLRGSSSLGIIMLTARRLEDDRLTGLEAGADIYLAKPVSFRELAAHIRALGRRLSSEPGAAPVPPPAPAPPPSWVIRRTAWRLVVPDGPEIPLSKLELRFLSCLAAVPERPVGRISLMEAIYGTILDSDSRALDAMVRRLKAKVEKVSGRTLPVQALYATGYVFSAPLQIVP